jgi:GT2 family glycosyltransferase
VSVLTAVVVTYAAGERLRPTLEKLEAALAQLDVPAEALVVDNASSDGTAALLASEFADLRVLRLDRNVGFAGGVAHGLAATDADWVALVNDDAEIEPDHLRLLLEAGRSADDVGTVTGQVRFFAHPGTINTAGLGMDCLGVSYDRLAGEPAVDGGATEEIFGASGCVVLYRRAMLDAVGGLDASFFAFMEDADLAWRARMAGWRCLYVPAAVAYHHGSATVGQASPQKYFLVGRNRMRMLARNATTGQLLRWGWAMALYDLAYVGFVALTDRTLAPLRGRVTGLRAWRRYRRTGAAARRPIALDPPTGPLGTWRQRAAYRKAAP